jgi:uncharacterized membrane protein YdjX (TVP38/TMEM64 family)
MLLALTFLAAYFLFTARDLFIFRESLAQLGYAGSFLCGMAYSYGFTSGPSTAVLLIISKEQNVIIASLIGGAGALISDMIIFKFVRHSLRDEVERLAESSVIKKISATTPRLVKKYVFSALAIFVIASPLPDEVGVSMLAACTTIKVNKFSVVSYALNTLGILSVLIIGNFI